MMMKYQQCAGHWKTTGDKMNIFVYDNNFEFDDGIFGYVEGYTTTYDEENDEFPAAIPEENSRLYGKVFDVHPDMIDSLDIFYGLVVGLHDRVGVVVHTEKGEQIEAQMYEYNACAIRKK